ncbi:hypothetical protein C1X72_15510 [Pseudomonas sp. FW306-2-2C-D06B]|uniref:hypothetical protein n=1 Tax=unclassified Pseudomonas TaxID=196821 RepID=UPI000C88E3B6|nr:MULTISPECIES: hypothetical protein [unclassified Pseudomonas]PMY80294.1 hypothetical protein C1X72_15510 [Pseudomonas sp. FW306-2-2C-D06B]PNA98403.1 hypothetical protein C1X74_11515 [Pseudomonas sp. GW460-5]PNB58861.1 hypothetical protein C1X73_12605 [Pseudomonas sp. FW305-130]POA73623.1 hypothetical protein C1890_27015 [Pseudomonas sp. DP16D-R1]
MWKITTSSEDLGIGQFGGSVRMNDPALWPVIPDTQIPLTPLCTLTEALLPVRFLPPGMAMTVFIAPNRKANGFNLSTMRRYTVHQQSELQAARESGYSRVLLHGLTDQELSPPESAFILDRTFIRKEEFTEEEEDADLEDDDFGLEISKLSGRPAFLQDPIYEPSFRYTWLLQLNSFELEGIGPRYEGIFENGLGHLILDKQARKAQQGAEAGYFFIQFT